MVRLSRLSYFRNAPLLFFGRHLYCSASSTRGGRPVVALMTVQHPDGTL
jgi:hypothetical protein